MIATQLNINITEIQGKELYRVGIIHKLPNYKAEIPLNYIFERQELRDFLLISACNAMAAIREDSIISQLYTTPRLIAIEKICYEYKKTS
jgi:hypothetical protein